MCSAPASRVTAIDTTPLTPPKVPSDLDELPALLRLHACLRLFLLDLEFSLSPQGHLRGLAKLACRVSLAVGMFFHVLIFVLACISVVIGIAVTVTGQIVVVLWHLLEAALLLLAVLVAAIVLFLIVGLIVRAR